MVLQLVGGTSAQIALHNGGLLHRLLTLIVIAYDGYFLLPYHTLTHICSFNRHNALCCPDFPPPFESDRTTYCTTKVRKVMSSDYELSIFLDSLWAYDGKIYAFLMLLHLF